MTTLNLDPIKPLLKQGHVGFAGVFGSRARGDAKKNSDLDMLVRFNKRAGLLHLIGLEQKLSKELGMKVDLVTEGGLSPYIRDRVLKDLQPIYGTR